MKLNILYITDNLISSSVFKSQVHNICHEHGKYNNVKILAFCKPKDLRVNIDNSNYMLIKSPRLPALSIPIVAKLTAFLFNDMELFKWADIIHCRGHGPSIMAFYLQKKFNISKPTIVDVRGAVTNEIRDSKDSFLNDFIAREIGKTEKIIFNEANAIFFVSDNMKKHFSESYDFSALSISIFPTIVNESLFKPMEHERQLIRKDLNIDDKFVYIYSGGHSYWQNIESILIEFDSKIKKHSNIHLLMLVLNKDSVISLVEKLNISLSDITILSLPYEEVGRYLNAGDAGLIIRDDSIVNYVASPTKINEYIACKLKIVDKLEEIGNLSYESCLWSDNYMSLDRAVEEQKSVYTMLKSGR